MIVYVAQVPSRQQMRMFTEVGRRVHAHSAGVGKAILAQLPDDEVLRIVRQAGMPTFTATTLRTEQELLADLDGIRARGYAIDEGEREVGVRCFAVAVPGASTPAAVSISGPEARVSSTTEPGMVSALQTAAGDLRAALRDAALV
jgi:IclR family acetate operon transcriptional repressor